MFLIIRLKDGKDGIKFYIMILKNYQKESFGTTQLEKSLDGDSADLEEIIMNSFGEERLLF